MNDFSRPAYALWPVLAVPVLIVLSGCEQHPAPPAPTRTRRNKPWSEPSSSWQKGETVDAMAKASPSIKVSDPKWERGDKLTKFELQGPGKPKGGQQAFASHALADQRQGKTDEGDGRVPGGHRPV